MFLLELCEIVFAGLFLIGMLTQVIIPIWNGTKLFPAVRRRTVPLEKLRAEAIEEIESAELEMETEQLKERAASIRPKKHTDDEDCGDPSSCQTGRCGSRRKSNQQPKQSQE